MKQSAARSAWLIARRFPRGSLNRPMQNDSDHSTRLLIGGEAVAGAGAPIAVETPYTTETIVEVAAASPEQVEAAAAFDYYAEIGRDHAGGVIPPIELSQLAMVVKDPLG